MQPIFDIEKLLLFAGILLSGAFLLALLLLAFIIWKIRKIQLPPNADFFTALRYTPLVIVIMIDLLDLSLDFLSAPFSWIILGKLGLEPLRGVSVIESIIPGTQVLPTMTIAWIIARLMKYSPYIQRMQ